MLVVTSSASVPSTFRSGTTALGTPIGTAESIQAWLANKIYELTEDVQRIRLLQHKQSEWLLIFYVIKSKVNYLLRLLHPSVTKTFAAAVDRLLRQALEDTISAPLPSDLCWDQARLPITMGGFGLSFTEDQAYAAYLASVTDVFDFLETHSSVPSPWLQEIDEALQIYAKLANCALPNTKDPLERVHGWRKEFRSDHPGNSQHQLMKQIYEQRQQLLLNTLKRPQASKKPIQHFLSASHQFSGKFLMTLPYDDRSTINNQDFEIICALRLRLPLICPTTQQGKAKKVIDAHGDYHLTCDNHMGCWQQRHDALRDAVADMAKQADIRVDVEPEGKFKDKRRADLIFRQSPLHNQKDVLFDVSVTHSINNSEGHASSCRQGYSASKREQKKISEYRADAAVQGMLFFPLVFETHGFVTEDVKTLIRQLAQRIADRTNSLYSQIVHFWTVKISTILQKANASIIKLQQQRLLSADPAMIDEDERAFLYETQKPVVSCRWD